MLIKCSHSGNAYSNDKRCSLIINEAERKKKTNIMDRISYQREGEREREKQELELLFFFYYCTSMDDRMRMYNINSFMTMAHIHMYLYECLLNFYISKCI